MTTGGRVLSVAGSVSRKLVALRGPSGKRRAMVTREGQLARVPRLIVPVLGGSRLSEQLRPLAWPRKPRDA
jgi:hypothetical protein